VERGADGGEAKILRRRIESREESGTECEGARIRGWVKFQRRERALRKRDGKGAMVLRDKRIQRVLSPKLN